MTHASGPWETGLPHVALAPLRTAADDPPPRRVTKGERTRERILDSATELFSRSGFHAISLRDIATHCGLTHAGLLHHFPGKESLLIEVLNRRDAVDSQVLFANDPAADPRAELGFILAVTARNMTTPGLVGLYVKIAAEATDPEHPAHHYFVQRYRVLRERLTLAFAALFAETPPPHAESPATVARQLLALMDGLQNQWLLEPESVDMGEAVGAFLRPYLPGTSP